MPPRRLCLMLVLSALLPGRAAELRAQCSVCYDHEPRWRGEALTLAANALVSGAAAGMQRSLRGGSFRDGFLQGAAGGALTYAGKRLAVEHFGGAGLLGRELAAVGASVSRNAADGRGPLERVVLPLGPVRVYVGAGAPVRARLDAAALVTAVYAATLPSARFDAAESLSSGALVFQRRGFPEDLEFNGLQMAGVMVLRHPPAGSEPPADFAEDLARTASHERVHVLQYDQGFLLWAAPAEAWTLSHARWSRGVNRYLDLGINAPLMASLGVVVPYDDRPWETEAYFLSRTRVEAERGGRDF